MAVEVNCPSCGFVNGFASNEIEDKNCYSCNALIESPIDPETVTQNEPGSGNGKQLFTEFDRALQHAMNALPYLLTILILNTFIFLIHRAIVSDIDIYDMEVSLYDEGFVIEENVELLMNINYSFVAIAAVINGSILYALGVKMISEGIREANG